LGFDLRFRFSAHGKSLLSTYRHPSDRFYASIWKIGGF
jgi:hypothetical protein